eukprot:Polyplicarium_translucidae@DN3333_c0_g3_i3.p1
MIDEAASHRKRKQDETILTHPKQRKTAPTAEDSSIRTMASSSPPLSGDVAHLYSRQIGAFGFEMMGKLVKMRILVSGLQGVGAEICKNLALAGPEQLVECLQQRLEPCEVCVLSCGVSCIYNSFAPAHKARKETPIKEVGYDTVSYRPTVTVF